MHTAEELIRILEVQVNIKIGGLDIRRLPCCPAGCMVWHGDHSKCAIEHNVVFHDNQCLFLVIQEAETNLKPVIEDSGNSSQNQVPGRSVSDDVEARYKGAPTGVSYRRGSSQAERGPLSGL